MFSLERGIFDRRRKKVLVMIAGVACAVAAIASGLMPTASAYPGPVDRDCPASGPCETVIQASDGNTYYADNLGGGRGFVVRVGPDGKPAETIEVSASEDEVALSRAEHGRRLALSGKDMSSAGVFGEGSSTEVRVNVVNVNGNGYVEFASDEDRPAELVVQVVGGDGQVYTSHSFDRSDPKLQSAFKDYLQGATALNTAATRLRALLGGAFGVSAAAVGALIGGVESKAFSEANVITAAAAVASVAIAGIVQLYNAWRDVDHARNNLINLFNNLNASAGRGVLPIPLVTFGGINAQSVNQNQFHSFRQP